MTPGGEARRAGSACERETTVPTTLHPTSAPAEVIDPVRGVLARLPALDFASSTVLDRPIAVLAQRAAEARHRLSDEAPTKDDDETDEDEDDDDVPGGVDDEDDDDWDDDDDDWDDDEDDDWDEDDDEDDDWDEDDEEEEDEDEDEDEEDEGAKPAKPVKAAKPVSLPPARRRR